MEFRQDCLRKLSHFKLVYGHCSVPYPWQEDPILSQWVVNIRQAKEHLPQELLDSLHALEFDFTPSFSTWQHFYGQLQEFHRQQGHLKVPRRNKDYQELRAWIRHQRLARWVRRQRENEETMPKERKAFHFKIPSSEAALSPLRVWMDKQR